MITECVGCLKNWPTVLVSFFMQDSLHAIMFYISNVTFNTNWILQLVSNPYTKRRGILSSHTVSGPGIFPQLQLSVDFWQVNMIESSNVKITEWILYAFLLHEIEELVIQPQNALKNISPQPLNPLIVSALSSNHTSLWIPSSYHVVSD